MFKITRIKNGYKIAGGGILNLEGYTIIDGENALGVYPVGSVYISVNNTSPAQLFGGTWERIAQGRALYGAGEIEPNGLTPTSLSTTKIIYNLGESKNAGIPNIMGNFSAKTYDAADTPKGAMFQSWSDTKVTPSGMNKDRNAWITFSAAAGECGTFTDNSKNGVNGNAFQNVPLSNNVYGKSMTVQTNAFVVNIWKRI